MKTQAYHPDKRTNSVAAHVSGNNNVMSAPAPAIMQLQQENQNEDPLEPVVHEPFNFTAQLTQPENKQPAFIPPRFTIPRPTVQHQEQSLPFEDWRVVQQRSQAVQMKENGSKNVIQLAGKQKKMALSDDESDGLSDDEKDAIPGKDKKTSKDVQASLRKRRRDEDTAPSSAAILNPKVKKAAAAIKKKRARKARSRDSSIDSRQVSPPVTTSPQPAATTGSNTEKESKKSVTAAGAVDKKKKKKKERGQDISSNREPASVSSTKLQQPTASSSRSFDK
jgi:hypothetical protein